MKKILIIKGMHCKHCAASVSNALESVDGVKGVKIDLKKQTALLNCDNVDEASLINAVSSAGFEVESIADKKTLF